MTSFSLNLFLLNLIAYFT
uniref:Uncharacterized protein n=1 Tax=Anguilla anguilla TaxID=7936 RepID=A0A0E9VCI3_ANGAN